MSSDEIINSDPIGRTSLTSATARANEFNRHDALFRDPFAQVYAGQTGPQTVKSFAITQVETYGPYSECYTDRWVDAVLRTVFFRI